MSRPRPIPQVSVTFDNFVNVLVQPAYCPRDIMYHVWSEKGLITADLAEYTGSQGVANSSTTKQNSITNSSQRPDAISFYFASGSSTRYTIGGQT